MSVRCPKCDYPNPAGRNACFSCGTPLPAETSPQPAGPGLSCGTQWVTEHSGGKMAWTSIGLLSAGIWMVLGGLALTFTIVGAIVGIPLILAGLIMCALCPILGYLQGTSKILRGRCPFCDLLIDVPWQTVREGWVDCIGCRSRILIRGNQFIRPNQPRP